MTTAVDDGGGGRQQQSTVAADDAGKMVADDGTVSCLHGRGGVTAVDDGRNGSGRRH
jgi:hypothetical protein